MVLKENNYKSENKTFKKSLQGSSENELNHFHSKNDILQDIDEDVFKKEAYRISNALHQSIIKLNPDEEDKLKRDIEVILSSFDKNPKNSDNYEMNIFENNFVQKSENNIKNNIDIFKSLREETLDYISNDFNNLAFEQIISGLHNENLINHHSDNVPDNNSSLMVYDDSNGLSNIKSCELFDDENLTYSFDDVGKLSDDEIAIKVDNITMEYKITQEKIDTVKEFVIRTIKRNKTTSTKFTALKNVSFNVFKGDRVGIVGFNGAGKSTLLKILSGVYDPTEGNIEINGRLAPLLELGAGFDYNYSGKSNIFLNGAFLGFSEEFLKEKYNEIVEFSELGESINFPVKNYSSGMRAKLGFSIATIVEPDILIIDEILSVGDIKFQRKSAKKLKSLIHSGITVLLVSHSVSQIRDICNKAIWIDNGEIKMMGEVNRVCDAYVKAADDATAEQLKNINLN